MASPKKISLGVFAAGELPFPVAHQFLSNEAAVNLTGYTAFVNIEGPDGDAVLGQGLVVVSDLLEGIVTYTWVEDDFQSVGKYRMLIWVDNDVNRFASDLIVYETYDGPGPTPEG
jgi:hypothetical protein